MKSPDDAPSRRGLAKVLESDPSAVAFRGRPERSAMHQDSSHCRTHAILGSYLRRIFMLRKLSLIAAGIALLATTSIFAQATRTWVSGVGDDANPCSRTAPCKTFAGAISKTASSGIISVLDPGGYGALTVTKPITLDGTGTIASILFSGTNGVVINITSGTNRDVVLRNISLDGSGSTLGIDGIRFLAGDSLTLEGVDIEQCSGDGIEIAPGVGATARVSVIRSTISQCGNGIKVAPSAATGVARVSIADTSLVKNGTGLFAQDIGPIAITVRNSQFTQNTTNAINAVSSSGNGVTTLVEDVEVTHGLPGGNGLTTSGAAARIRVSNSSIFGNSIGINAGAGSELCTFGTNRVTGNATNGTFTGTCSPDDV
jgi:hypothetical protein